MVSIAKVFEEIASGFVNELMFSSNNKEEKGVFGRAVKSRIDNTCTKLESTVDSVVDLGTKAFDMGKDIYEEAKTLDPSNLTADTIKSFPKCLENTIGDTYEGQIHPDELVEDEQVQKIGQDIISQSGRADLKFKILVKSDDEVNAKVIPGGRIVITTGMLNKLHEGTDQTGYEKKLAHVLSYLVARASGSQEVKKAKLSGLMFVVGKIFSAALKIFFPVKTTTVKGQKKVVDEDKKKFASTTIAELGLSLGSKALLHEQDGSADTAARELAFDYLNPTKYGSSKDDLDDTLDQLFASEDVEAYKDEIALIASKMARHAIDIAV